MLGCTVGTARGYISRALTTLRAEARGGDPMIEDELRAAFARHEPTRRPATMRADRRAGHPAPASRRCRPAAASVAGRRAGARCARRAAGRAGSPPRTAARRAEPAGVAAGAGRPRCCVLGDRPRGAAGHRADTVHAGAPAGGPAAGLSDLAAPGPGGGHPRSWAATGSTRRSSSGGAARPDLRPARPARQAVAGRPGCRSTAASPSVPRCCARITDAVGRMRVCLDRPVTSRHTGLELPDGLPAARRRAVADLVRQRHGLPNGAYDRDAPGSRCCWGCGTRRASGTCCTKPAKVTSCCARRGAA